MRQSHSLPYKYCNTLSVYDGLLTEFLVQRRWTGLLLCVGAGAAAAAIGLMPEYGLTPV